MNQRAILEIISVIIGILVILKLIGVF